MPKNKTKQFQHLPVLIVFACFVFAVSAAPRQPELDYAYLGEGHFFDARSTALGGAGCALPYGISSMRLNPALLQSFDRLRPFPHGGVYAGYGRDSMFSGTILPAGLWYCQPLLGSAGLSYRLLQQADTNYQYEFNLTHSKRFFEKNLSQGPVDYGLSVRYEKTGWVSNNVMDTLFQYHRDTLRLLDSSFSDYAAIKRLAQQRLIVDLGFYQSSIAEHLDFGITFKNLLGYAWTEANPYIHDTVLIKKTRQITGADGTVQTQVIESVDSLYYTHAYKKSEGWLDLRYKNIQAGVCYHNTVANGAVTVTAPIDLEFISLFDSRQKKGVILRCGVEAAINHNICIRGGYARAPPAYYNGISINPVSRFSGGAGFKSELFNVDFYLAASQWGLSMNVVF